MMKTITVRLNEDEAKAYENFAKLNNMPLSTLWIYVKSLDTFCLSFFLGQHPEWIVPHPK